MACSSLTLLARPPQKKPDVRHLDGLKGTVGQEPYIKEIMMETFPRLAKGEPCCCSSEGPVPGVKLSSDLAGKGRILAAAIILVAIVAGSINASAEIPSTGLSLWVQADGGVTVDGSGYVSAWADQSAQHNDLSQ